MPQHQASSALAGAERSGAKRSRSKSAQEANGNHIPESETKRPRVRPSSPPPNSNKLAGPPPDSTASPKPSTTPSSIVNTLNGHTLHKASLLRASRLERAAAQPAYDHLFLASIPYEVHQAADAIFTFADEAASKDARFYLRPKKVTVIDWNRAAVRYKNILRQSRNAVQRTAVMTGFKPPLASSLPLSSQGVAASKTSHSPQKPTAVKTLPHLSPSTPPTAATPSSRSPRQPQHPTSTQRISTVSKIVLPAAETAAPKTLEQRQATAYPDKAAAVSPTQTSSAAGFLETLEHSGAVTTVLTLPPELRNYIYELVLVQGTAVELNTTIETAKLPALLVVCRKFRQEALPMYYSGNEFIATVHNANTAYLCLWLNAIGPKSGCHIRHIILQCDGRIASWFGGVEDAQGHYFAAVIRCLIASSVCYGAIEFHHSAMPDYVPGQEFDHSPPSHSISDNRGDRFAAYMFLHWEAPRYVFIAGYDTSRRCNQCRGLLHHPRGLLRRQSQNVASGHVFGTEARIRAWAALPLPHFVPDQQNQERRLWEAQVQLVEQYLAIIRKEPVRKDERVDSKFKFDFGVVAALKWCRLQSGAGETKWASTWLNKVAGEFEIRVRAALKSKER